MKRADALEEQVHDGHLGENPGVFQSPDLRYVEDAEIFLGAFRLDADLFMKSLLVGMVQPVADPSLNIDIDRVIQGGVRAKDEKLDELCKGFVTQRAELYIKLFIPPGES